MNNEEKILQLKGRKGVYFLDESFVPPQASGWIKSDTSKLDQSFFKMMWAEDKDKCLFLVKRVMFPSRLQPDISKFVEDVNKISCKMSLKPVFRLYDYIERENMIYLIHEYIPGLERLSEIGQIKEINVVNIIREIANYYNEMSNNILKPLANHELGIKELNISNVFYDKNEYNVFVDILNFGDRTNRKMLLEPNLDQTHMRGLGECVIQLLFGRPKEKKSLKTIFEENEKKENGVQITNVMKNLIGALFSRNPPAWDKFIKHPLLNPTNEADYETWKNEFNEDEGGNEVDDGENRIYTNILKHLRALDSLNDVKLLFSSSYEENFVRLYIFLLLRCIVLYDIIIEDLRKPENENNIKKKAFLKQMNLKSQELKDYFYKIIKKNSEESDKVKSTIDEWMAKLNEVEFNLDMPIEKSRDWLLCLQKLLKGDVGILFDFLKKQNSELYKEKEHYWELIFRN